MTVWTHQSPGSYYQLNDSMLFMFIVACIAGEANIIVLSCVLHGGCRYFFFSLLLYWYGAALLAVSPVLPIYSDDHQCKPQRQLSTSHLALICSRELEILNRDRPCDDTCNLNRATLNRARWETDVCQIESELFLPQKTLSREGKRVKMSTWIAHVSFMVSISI